MNAPDHPGGSTAEPAPSVSPPRRLRRHRPAKIGGVAAGVARYLGVDPLFARIAFVILTIGGPGLFVYLAAWLLVPDDTDPDPRPIALTSNITAMVFGFIVLSLGAADVLSGLTDERLIVPAALVAVGIFLLNQRETPSNPADGVAFASPGPTASWPPSATGFTPPPDGHHQPATAGNGPGDGESVDAASGSTGSDASATVAGPLAASEDATAQLDLGNPSPDEPGPVAPRPSFDGGPPPWDDDPVGHAWAIPKLPETDVEAGPDGAGRAVTALSLALAAVAAGVFLVLANVAGLAVSAALVLGTFLAILGLGIVAGSFVGRTPILWLLALPTLALLAVSPLVDAAAAGGVGTRTIRVTSNAELESSYAIGMGELILDLSDLEMTEDRTIDVDVGAGYAEIRVPADLDVRVEATSRAGYVEVFDAVDEGVGNSVDQRQESTVADGPVLTLDVGVTFGYVEVSAR